MCARSPHAAAPCAAGLVEELRGDVQVMARAIEDRARLGQALEVDLLHARGHARGRGHPAGLLDRLGIAEVAGEDVGRRSAAVELPRARQPRLDRRVASQQVDAVGMDHHPRSRTAARAPGDLREGPGIRAVGPERLEVKRAFDAELAADGLRERRDALDQLWIVDRPAAEGPSEGERQRRVEVTRQPQEGDLAVQHQPVGVVQRRIEELLDDAGLRHGPLEHLRELLGRVHRLDADARPALDRLEHERPSARAHQLRDRVGIPTGDEARDRHAGRCDALLHEDLVAHEQRLFEGLSRDAERLTQPRRADHVDLRQRDDPIDRAGGPGELACDARHRVLVAQVEDAQLAAVALCRRGNAVDRLRRRHIADALGRVVEVRGVVDDAASSG